MISDLAFRSKNDRKANDIQIRLNMLGKWKIWAN